METPADLKYAKTDEWVKVEGNVATIGVTDYAQHQLSDVVFVEINLKVGDAAVKGKVFGTIESVKAASDINIPVSGKVKEINESLSDSPEKVNTEPYSSAWFIKVEMSNTADLNELMDAAVYDKYCETRGH
jgi:glycine cleavage system H protein